MLNVHGIIFDMDGVLVDSEEYICQAAIAMFAEHGVTAGPNDFLPFVGTGEDRYLGGVAEQHGFPIDIERDKARTYEIYTDIVHGHLSPLPGVHEFMGKCRELGLKLALATSADRVKMGVNLREMGLPLDTFDALVNGLDVEHKKPAPDIFLRAAELLDLPPRDCLVVEDAVNGVAAANAAGAQCLALTTSFTETQLAGADYFAADLADALPLLGDRP
jgi:HAD superfamily hydrolase (TIGR01509 family)